MENVKPGEHPLTDIVIHKRKVFSAEVDRLVRDVHHWMPLPKMMDLLDWLDPPPVAEIQALLAKTRDDLRREARERGPEEEEE